MNLKIGTAEGGDPAEHAENEDQAGRVEGEHEVAEGEQRADAVLADREGHRAESADGRELHDEADDAEEDMADDVDEPRGRFAPFAERLQPEREQDGEKRTCRISPVAKAPTTVEGMMSSGNRPCSGFRLRRERRDRLGVDRREIDVHADPRLPMFTTRRPMMRASVVTTSK